MVAPTLPSSTQVLYADANGNVTGSATATFSSSLLTVGPQTPISAYANARFQGVGVDNTACVLALDGFGVNGAPSFIGRNTSGTKASPTATAQFNTLAYVGGCGFNDAAAYTGIVASFKFIALQNFTTTNQGTYFSLYLTPNNSTTAAATLTQYGGGATYFPLLGTTASAANAFLDSGSTPANQLLRSTSSSRYKEDIEPMDVEIARKLVTESRPVWFHSKCAADRSIAPATKDGRPSFYGLVAEDVAALDPRLVFWTHPEESYEWKEEWDQEGRVIKIDEEGNETEEIQPPRLISRDRVLKEDADRSKMIPDGVQYDRMVVPLILVAQQQAAQIAELQKAVAELLKR